MQRKCNHQPAVKNSWLSGPRIVCRRCGKRWDVRGKMLVDVCCWGVDILVLALSPLLFGDAMRDFASYGRLSGWIGYAIICLIIGPFMMAVHFSVFALGHGVYGWVIRRSGDLRRWIAEDPYHTDV